MNWEAIGAVGEILGALAVFITLAYLAVQVRQYTLATRAAINSAYSDAAREFNLALATTPELARALANWPEDPADASPEDQVLVLALLRALFQMWQNGFRQWRDGTLDPLLMTALKKEIATYSLGASDDPELFKRANQVAFAWSLERFIFDPDFQELLDGLFANPDQVLNPAG
jgi:hypothetical protein